MRDNKKRFEQAKKTFEEMKKSLELQNSGEDKSDHLKPADYPKEAFTNIKLFCPNCECEKLLEVTGGFLGDFGFSTYLCRDCRKEFTVYTDLQE